MNYFTKEHFIVVTLIKYECTYSLKFVENKTPTDLKIRYYSCLV